MSATTVTLYSQDSPPTLFTPFSPLSTTEGGGESFTPTQTAILSQVQFRLARTSDIAGSAVCQIYLATKTLGGLFNGAFGPALGTSGTIDLSTVPVIDTNPAGGLVTFTFANGPTLEAGTAYVAVLVALFTGTHLDQFGCNNCDPVNNAVVLVGADGTLVSVWTAEGSIDYNMIVIGLILTVGTLYLVVTFGDGTPAIPATATLTGPGVTQSQRTSLPNLFVLTFPNLPVGSGYTITLEYTDCTGVSQHVVSPPFAISGNICIVTEITGITSSPPVVAGLRCQTLPNFFLNKFFPSSTAGFDLFGSRLTPLDHHFSISNITDPITAHVQNDGNENYCGLIQFDLLQPDGTTVSFFGSGTSFANSIGLATDFVTLAPGQTMDIVFRFTPTMLGDYHITATPLWDTVEPLPRHAGLGKTIRISVVS